MEDWNKGNKMIQRIQEKQDPHEYARVSEARLRGMEQLASTHITWFTHKNPYGCWICDLFVLTQSVLDSFREFLGPELEEPDTPAQHLDGAATPK